MQDQEGAETPDDTETPPCWSVERRRDLHPLAHLFAAPFVIRYALK